MNRGTFSLLGQLLGPSFGPGSTDLEDHLVTTPVLGLTFWSHAGHLLLYGRTSMAAPSWLRLHGCTFSLLGHSWVPVLDPALPRLGGPFGYDPSSRSNLLVSSKAPSPWLRRATTGQASEYESALSPLYLSNLLQIGIALGQP